MNGVITNGDISIAEIGLAYLLYYVIRIIWSMKLIQLGI